MKLFLIRHGQTEWNQQGRMQGHGDSPLTERGRRQADLTGKALCAYHVSHFFCSDAGRALETVERILKESAGLPMPRRDPRLREINYGRWEGLVRKEIEDGYPELYRAYKRNPESFKAPDGESFQDLQDRFLSFLAEVPQIDNEDCLVVAHNGIIRVAVLALTKRGLNELAVMPPMQEASITILESTRGDWKLLESSGTKHLSGLPA
jgi:phosphoserine phosphatase